MDVPSAAIVLAIVVQTIVMIIFLMLSTGKIEAQTTRLADKFSNLINTMNKLENTIDHHDQARKDHEFRLRAIEQSSQRIDIKH